LRVRGSTGQVTAIDGGITTQCLDVHGDTAVETSRISWTFQRPDGTQLTRNGRALTVWRRGSDGKWLMLAGHPEYDPQK
jgi:ketosteroid isomerase-like protein